MRHYTVELRVADGDALGRSAFIRSRAGSAFVTLRPVLISDGFNRRRLFLTGSGHWFRQGFNSHVNRVAFGL